MAYLVTVRLPGDDYKAACEAAFRYMHDIAIHSDDYDYDSKSEVINVQEEK